MSGKEIRKVSVKTNFEGGTKQNDQVISIKGKYWLFYCHQVRAFVKHSFWFPFKFGFFLSKVYHFFPPSSRKKTLPSSHSNENVPFCSNWTMHVFCSMHCMRSRTLSLGENSNNRATHFLSHSIFAKVWLSNWVHAQLFMGSIEIKYKWIENANIDINLETELKLEAIVRDPMLCVRTSRLQQFVLNAIYRIKWGMRRTFNTNIHNSHTIYMHS